MVNAYHDHPGLVRDGIQDGAPSPCRLTTSRPEDSCARATAKLDTPEPLNSRQGVRAGEDFV